MCPTTCASIPGLISRHGRSRADSWRERRCGKKLGEYLLEAGLVTEQQLKEALRRQPSDQGAARPHPFTHGDGVRGRHLPRAASRSSDSPSSISRQSRSRTASSASSRKSSPRNTPRHPDRSREPHDAPGRDGRPAERGGALEDLRFQSGYFVRVPAFAHPRRSSRRYRSTTTSTPPWWRF